MNAAARASPEGSSDLSSSDLLAAFTPLSRRVARPAVLRLGQCGKLKGASSHYVNHELINRKVLEWQVGYGVVSFGTKDLKWVVNYIRNQKEHHRKRTTVQRLERITHDEEDES